jgi:S1-C subfamily serine protease
MLWLFFLSCILGYEEEGSLTTLSIEQTYAAHYHNYSKAINSSLKISVFDDDFREVGHGSGNHFKIGKHRFVMTAAHVVSDPDFLIYVASGGIYTRLDVVFLDEANDIAILIPAMELKNNKPTDYRTNNRLDITGLTVVHAGYPSDLGLSVFHGTVASCSPDSMMMQSFALPGSSGSVVFDNKGRVVGVLSALKMGMYGYSPYPQIHPGLVYVSRVDKYSRYDIEEIIVKWKNSKSEH